VIIVGDKERTEGGAMAVVVLGSANLDLVYRLGSFPKPGETILAEGSERHRGGKGNNQAVAAARAGAVTTFIAAVGRDESAELIIAGLTEAGIRPLLRRTDGPTGTAVIMVDGSGENAIMVDAGANADLRDLTRAELDAVAAGDLLLAQLEVPTDTVRAAAEHAHHAGTLVVLNAAPMTPLPDGLTDAVDLLVVNQTEAEQLAGPDHRGLLDLVPAAIVTLGGEGAWLAVRGQEPRTVPGRVVPVVDTTGAGDSFCGALAAQLDRARARSPINLDQLESAARYATAAAALAVGRPGATASIPTAEEIDALLTHPSP
jgi:ribokinase